MRECLVPQDIRLADDIVERLCCPVCRAGLARRNDSLVCVSEACGTTFPLVDGIPVLINKAESVFRVEDFASDRETFFERPCWPKTLAARLIPRLGRNIKGRANFREFAKHLFARSRNPRVLILGGSVVGEGLDEILSMPGIEFVETDVATGPRTRLICDAHHIPFQDETFDGVIVQAVLEHVADPQRCVDEIHRTMKDKGIVYAETAFMQPVHGGKYDFTRFTDVGHRRLFRRFDEIAGGAVCGPGMALASAYRYFLRSFAAARWSRMLAYLFAVFTAWPLKYADYLVIDKPTALDAAAGVYFLGTKTDAALSDRDVCESYRGGTG